MMPRISPLSPTTAAGLSKVLLEVVGKTRQRVPNFMRAMAHSPAALEGYVNFADALKGSRLSDAECTAIALAVAGTHHCEYSASMAFAEGRDQGLAQAEMRDNLAGNSASPRISAILRFVNCLLNRQGSVSDGDLAKLQSAGFDERDVAEIVALVGLNVFATYFSKVAQTECDYPEVKLNGVAVAS